MAPTLEELSERLRNSSTGLEDIEAAIRASQPPPRQYGWGDAIAQGLIGGIPLLVGALSGRKSPPGVEGNQGIYAGAQGGLLGLQAYEAEKERRRQEEKELGVKAADIFLKRQEKAEDRGFQTELELGKGEQRKELEKEKQKAIYDRREKEKEAGILGRGGEGVSDYKTSLETQKIQNEFDRLTKQYKEQAGGIKQARDLLNDPSGVSAGALKVALARASGEKGTLALQDVERVLPSTLVGDFVGAWNYITGRTESPLTEKQKNAVKEYLKVKAKTLDTSILQAQGEVAQRANSLAPSLTRQGTIRDVLNSLGESFRYENTWGEDVLEEKREEREKKENSISSLSKLPFGLKDFNGDESAFKQAAKQWFLTNGN